MRLLSWGSSVLGPCPRLLLVIPGMCPLSVVVRKWSSPNMPTMLKETNLPDLLSSLLCCVSTGSAGRRAKDRSRFCLAPSGLRAEGSG